MHHESRKRGVEALRTLFGGEEGRRSVSLSLVDKEVYGARTASRGGFDFFFLLIVTFSNLMESSGRTEGERGVLSEKILKDFCRVGSEKDGVVEGLEGD